MAKRQMLLTAILIVALLGGGSAAASRGTVTAVTIESVVPHIKWHESFAPGATLTVSGTSSIVGTLEASFRNVATHRLDTVTRFSVSGGSFTKVIKISARPVPGTYLLRLKEFPVGAAADREVVVPAPPEGVVDRVYFSRTQNGPPVRVLRGRTSTIFAHFHFAARPQARVVNFIWKKPGNPKVRFTGAATKPYSTTVSSYVCAKYVGQACGGGTLRKGKWYAILKAAGRVTKRELVTVD